MKLKEIYSGKTVISFEVFPPQNSIEKLLAEIKILKKYNPKFISLTCGAGGKENKSFELLKSIKDLDIEVMPHFTCITSSKQSVKEGLKEIENMGIENILALRGDTPKDLSIQKYDFKYANELVEFIKHKTSLSIGVAGYPEGHIESPDLKTDIKNLKRKIDAGADVIFTQLFFDNQKFYDYIELIKDFNTPVAAGIMPIISKKQIEKMTSMAKISIPKIISEKLEKYNDKDLLEFGIDYACKQCQDLITNGVDGLHFFTLNKSYSTSKILDNIS